MFCLKFINGFEFFCFFSVFFFLNFDDESTNHEVAPYAEDERGNLTKGEVKVDDLVDPIELEYPTTFAFVAV